MHVSDNVVYTLSLGRGQQTADRSSFQKMDNVRYLR
jgi:hypothetical protein